MAPNKDLRKRNIAMLVVLLGLVVLFFLISIAKMGGFS